VEKKVILCDSNIVFKYFRGEENIVQEIDYLGFSRLAISAVSIAEMYFGMKKSEIRSTKELINKFNYYPNR
jgi:predicted nucleic acid-binding protein